MVKHHWKGAQGREPTTPLTISCRLPRTFGLQRHLTAPHDRHFTVIVRRQYSESSRPIKATMTMTPLPLLSSVVPYSLRCSQFAHLHAMRRNPLVALCMNASPLALSCVSELQNYDSPLRLAM